MSSYVSSFDNPSREDLVKLTQMRDEDLRLKLASNIGDDYESSYNFQILSILLEGIAKKSRPGQYTLTKPGGVQFKADLTNFKLPLLTKRYIPFKTGLVELFWFLKGQTNIHYLKDHGVSIWDEWVKPETAIFEVVDNFTPKEAMNYIRILLEKDYPGIFKSLKTWLGQNKIAKPTIENIDTFLYQTYGFTLEREKPTKLVLGDIGSAAYGAQWRHWKSQDQEVDQIAQAIELLRKDPDSRRIIVNCWDPSKVKDCSLPWCHYGFQFISTYNNNKDKRDLTIVVTQRSADVLLGTPTNMFQYALLCHLVASVTNHEAKEIFINVADAHIYEDQLPHLKDYLNAQQVSLFPSLVIKNTKENIDDYNIDDIEVINYSKEKCSTAITFPVAV